MSTDEDLERSLRARADAAFETVELDPAPLVRAGRRRIRRARWARGAAAVVVLVAVGFGAATLQPDRAGVPVAETPAPVAAPPAEPDAPFSLWISADAVPTGDAEVMAALVAHEDVADVFGALVSVEVWDGEAWQDRGHLVACLVGWQCTSTVERGGEVAVPAIGLSAQVGRPGPLFRLSAEGLEPGWYRLSQTSNDGLVATGVLEVRDGAEEPVPLGALEDEQLFVTPGLLPTTGGQVDLNPYTPPDENGYGSIEDVVEAFEGAAETARVERWDGSAWVAVVEVPLAEPDIEGLPEGSYQQRTAVVPALGPGAHRMVREGPSRSWTGQFWVVEDAA